MSFSTKLFFSFIALAASLNLYAQNQTAVVGEATQVKINIANAGNSKKCHIEVILPDQTKTSLEVEGPQFLAIVDITPQKTGSMVIQWEGKNKIRGVNTVFACPGKGVIQLDVNANAEQIAQKWSQYFSQISEEVQECVKYGMDLSQFKYQILADPTVTLTSPDDPKLKPIYQKCESFAKQNQPKKAFACVLPLENNAKSTCDGVYAEKQSDGKLKPISRANAIQLHFEGKPWVTGQVENADARILRLKQEEQSRAKQAAEQAAKIEAEEKAKAAKLKQEEEIKLKQAAELAAKLEAEEKERKFKESPEYKKQQAEIERKRIADEKQAAALKAKEEKDAAILCKTDAEKCLTTEMLMNSFQGVSEIRNICTKSVKAVAKWDYQFQSAVHFTSYYDSRSDLKEGIVRLIDDDVKFQNGFGAWKTMRVTCHYNIKSKFAMSFVD